MINKKRLIIFSSLILTLCFGLFFVFGSGEDYSSSTTITVTMPQSPAGVDNVTKGGLNETINFTMAIGSSVNGTENITQINFDLPGNVIMNDLNNISNGTGLISGWDCDGATLINLTYTTWNCSNQSDSQLSGGDNIAIWFNYTANSTGTEEDVSWVITICGGVTTTSCNTTTYRTRLDDYAPRLIELNITDGNTTLSNGTSSLGRHLLNASNVSLMYSSSDYTVYATINDTQLSSVYLYCNNGSIQSANTTVGAYVTQFNNSGFSATTGLSQSDVNLYYYTATMPSNCIHDGNATNFVVLINDSVNNFRQYNETTVGPDVAFSFGTNSSVLRLGSVNVTDGAYTRSVLDNTKYLRASVHTLDIYLYGENKNVNTGQMLVYYNETGSMTKGANGAISKSTLELFNTVDNFTSTAGDAAARFVTYFNFSGTGNDTQTIEFYIVANDSNNYVTVGGPYKYKIDSAAAVTPVMTVPTDRAIGFSDSIIYKCASSDAGIGLGAWSWRLTKPDSTTVTNAGGTSASDSITYSSTTINQAGVYSIKCTAQDLLAQSSSYTSTSSDTFTVLYSSGTGGGGGGGSSTTVSFDVDFSGTVSEATLKAQQGVKKTFSFDGTTKHTITFKEVTTNKVVLEIASDPVTVELAIGETVDVDVNGDGVMDMSVTLNSIENDNADITVMKYEEGAEIIKAEEEAARGVEEAAEEAAEEEPTVTGPEVESKAWIWILVLVIAVVGVVAYFVMRKK